MGHCLIIFSGSQILAQETFQEEKGKIASEDQKGKRVVGVGLDLLQLPLGVWSAEIEFATGRSTSFLLSPRIKPIAAFEESRFAALGMEYRKYLHGSQSNKWMEGLYVSAYASAKYFPSLSLRRNDSNNWQRSTAIQVGGLIGTKAQFSNGMYLGINTGLVFRSRLLHSDEGVVSTSDNNYEAFFTGDELAETVIKFRGLVPKFGLKMGITF